MAFVKQSNVNRNQSTTEPRRTRKLLKLTIVGAINYGTSALLCNLGYNLNNDVADDEEAQDDQRWTADEVQDYLDDLSLCFYDIELKAGYYEGFYLDISDINGDYYSDEDCKEERIKELHRIGRALIYLTNYCGLVNYAPGWCTGYATTDGTITAIKKAVKKEITEIHNLKNESYEKEKVCN